MIRRERELASKIRAPAEAEKYKLEIMAKANRVKSVSEVIYTFRVLLKKTSCSLIYAIIRVQ
jgi:hypothetical protein